MPCLILTKLTLYGGRSKGEAIEWGGGIVELYESLIWFKEVRRNILVNMLNNEITRKITQTQFYQADVGRNSAHACPGIPGIAVVE